MCVNYLMSSILHSSHSDCCLIPLAVIVADPFVSQTVFQGFSCRQLDENEEWLDVDFQISCTSDSYLAFVSLGTIGVFVYPLGLPTCALLLLFKNSGARVAPISCSLGGQSFPLRLRGLRQLGNI